MILRLVLASALVLPVTGIFAGTASAGITSCLDVWTGQQTASKSYPLPNLLNYYATVKYKLMYNTCNLGVYTKIQVDSFTDQYVIYGETLGRTWMSDLGKVLKDCTGHADSGCLVYPGVAAYTDNVDKYFGAGNGTITRTDYPGAGYNYAYSLTTGTFDYLRTTAGVPYYRFVYQFLRNQIYAG